MSIRKIITNEILKAQGELIGTIVSPIRELWDDAGGMVYCADVDIGKDTPLKDVPIATNNVDIYYSDTGRPVALRRLSGTKWSIVGLAKTAQDLTHFIYMSFEDDIAQVVSNIWRGNVIRRLTWAELGSLAPAGFGSLPWGVVGRFDVYGTLIEIMEG